MHRYERKPLKPGEQRQLLEVLHEQMEKQHWFVVVVLRDTVAEIAVPIN